MVATTCSSGEAASADRRPASGFGLRPGVQAAIEVVEREGGFGREVLKTAHRSPAPGESPRSRREPANPEHILVVQQELVGGHHPRLRHDHPLLVDLHRARAGLLNPCPPELDVPKPRDDQAAKSSISESIRTAESFSVDSAVASP